MKKILSTLFVMMAVSVSAQANQDYVKHGECAVFAAEAAAKWAAKAWNTTTSKVQVTNSDIMTSSNPAPIEIYAVGIKGPWRNSDLLTVAIENNGGFCTVLDIRLADFLN